MTALADLHRHLDGSLPRETLRELLASEGRELPEPLGFRVGMGLDAALACFELTLSVLQRPDAVKRVAHEICQQAATEGVTTLEIRFAPQLHRGAPIEEIVDAAVEGAEGRAGIILCGLYGEPPSMLDKLVEVASQRDGVVAIDLAGGPSGTENVTLLDYQSAFSRARELGLGRTVHAGEGRPAQEIRVAVEHLHAQRIGHGLSLLDDDELVELVIARGVTIEACPTSNLHTGVIDSIANHPLGRWLARGVRACINTDNTLFSQVDAPTEYARARTIVGVDEQALAAAIRYGHAAAFQTTR